MEVEVKLYAALRRYRPETAGGAPHHPFVVTLSEGATIAALMAQLGIPEGLVAAVSGNNNAVDMDFSLQNGDKVDIFPPVAGG